MKHILPALFLLCTAVLTVSGQSEVLDAYIREALLKNEELRSGKLQLSKDRLAIKEAGAGFMPTLGFNARYTVARGGRADTLPVREIFSGVAIPGLNPDDIPPQVVSFLREREHETKLSFVMPVIEPSLVFQRKLRQDQYRQTYLAYQTDQRKVVHDLKHAYYRHLITLEVRQVWLNAIDLMQENLRVTQRLVDNGKATFDKIKRAEAELAGLEASLIEAERDVELSKGMFNLLMNRPLDSDVQADSSLRDQLDEMPELEDAVRSARNAREELQQLQLGIASAGKMERLNRWMYAPRLAVAADYGFQGITYEFNTNQDFFIGSLVLRWNFFDGMAAKHKAGQARLDQQMVESQLRNTRKQIELQVLEAKLNVDAAAAKRLALEKKYLSTEDNYRLVDKRYRQQMANQLEYLDAQNNLQQAAIEEVIAAYNYRMALATFEYVTATYPLEP